MKTSSVSLALLGATLLAVPARAPIGMTANRQKLIKRYDRNGDGQLNDTARAAAEQFRAEQVKKFDQDGDGRLNDAGKEAARKAFRAGPPANKRKQDPVRPHLCCTGSDGR